MKGKRVVSIMTLTKRNGRYEIIIKIADYHAETCCRGKRMLFINCHELLLRLRIANEKGTLECYINRYASYDLLVIDESSYPPIDYAEASLFFQFMI